MNQGLPAVLVTCGGGFQGLAVVRLLGEADAFRIIVADNQDATLTASFADATYRLPPVAERADFEQALLGLCRSQAVRLVLPSTDFELEALAAARSELEGLGTSVAVCDAPLLALLRDKHALYERLSADGFPVLRPWTGPLDAAPPPLIGKPRHGFGGRGVVVARTALELAELAPHLRESLLWQPFLDGADEISADFAIVRRGATAIGLRRRVRTSGGFAVVSEGSSDAQARSLAERFAVWVATRGGRGLFNVQLLRRGATLVVSDVNPRLGTSAVHWRGSGFNPVLEVCADAGLVPAAREGALAPSATRSVRHLEERIEPVSGEVARVSGVVFDLDDTLVPTKRWTRERLLRALDVLLPEPQRARAQREALRLIEECPRGLLIDAVASALGFSETERVRLLETYRATWPESCGTYSEVKPALDALRRRGLRLGLLTDNPKQTQLRKVQAAGLASFFHVVVYARESGAEKPDPRGFAAVAQGLDLPPESLAMAGDNPHRDLSGAAEAGFARLFWVQREGAACAFDPALAAALPGAARYERVSDLRQLAARLESSLV